MQSKSFIGITVHFIKGHEMCSISLEVVVVTESHTSAFIMTQLENMLNDWNIERIIPKLRSYKCILSKAV